MSAPDQVDAQVAQLEAAIAAQEAVRGSLGDGVVDVTVVALRRQLAALRNGDAQRR